MGLSSKLEEALGIQEETLGEAGFGDLEKPAQDMVNLCRDLYRLVGRIESAARRMKRVHPALSANVLNQLVSIDQKARYLSVDVDETLGLD